MSIHLSLRCLPNTTFPLFLSYQRDLDFAGFGAGCWALADLTTISPKTFVAEKFFVTGVKMISWDVTG